MRLISKGDLLVLLGESSNSFTRFLTAPEEFGLQGDWLDKIKIAKQKFDWATNLDLDLPEVKELITLLFNIEILNREDVGKLNAWRGEPDSQFYEINIRPLDTITTSNVYGFEKTGANFTCRVDFVNSSTQRTHIEYFSYPEIPEEEVFEQFLIDFLNSKRREWSS